MKVEEDRFLFEFACLRSGQSVDCSGTVTNKAPQTRSLCPEGGYFVDDQGNKYPEIRASLNRSQLVLRNLREVSYQQPFSAPCLEGLEPELRINTSFSAKGVGAAATRLTYIGAFAWSYGDHFVVRYGNPDGRLKLTVRNIPIGQR